MPPIFVVGLSRSGTSLLSALISKHIEVEMIAKGHVNKDGSWKDGAIRFRPCQSTYGYAETRNIWEDLDTNNTVDRKGESWHSPKYISYTYQDHFISDKLCEKLRCELEEAIRTDKIPLIKKPPYTLKIGTLHKIFPDSKFVFIMRNKENWINGVSYRLQQKKPETEIEKHNRNRIGLHWYLINSIALFDLNYYVPDQYYITQLEILQRNDINTEKEMRKIFDFCGLKQPNEVDLIPIDKKFQHTLNDRVINLEEEFKLLYEIMKKK